MANRPKICTDRILPRELMRLQQTRSMRGGGRRAIAPIGKTWMNGSTLRVRFLGGSSMEQAVAKEQAGWWSAVANLKFEFNNALNADIRIAFDQDDGAWSYVGMDCRSIQRRGFCPSCGARRMAETAAYLVDRVIPRVPVRQWVLSFPIPLRIVLAAHPELLTPVLGILHRVITGFLVEQAGLRRGAADAGGVTLIRHKFGVTP